MSLLHGGGYRIKLLKQKAFEMLSRVSISPGKGGSQGGSGSLKD